MIVNVILAIAGHFESPCTVAFYFDNKTSMVTAKDIEAIRSLGHPVVFPSLQFGMIYHYYVKAIASNLYLLKGSKREAIFYPPQIMKCMIGVVEADAIDDRDQVPKSLLQLSAVNKALIIINRKNKVKTGYNLQVDFPAFILDGRIVYTLCSNVLFKSQLWQPRFFIQQSQTICTRKLFLKKVVANIE